MLIEASELDIEANDFSPERFVERSRGLHLSHVLNFIEQREFTDSKGGQTYMMAGFLWERVLERLLNDPENLWDWMFTAALNEHDDPNIIRPGEQCVDGIYMTPDGFNIETGRLEEWKYTTKSIRNPITGPKFQRWMWQIMAYCRSLGLDRATLRVFFARGDYTTGRPIPMNYDLDFTETEIEENWRMIILNANAMLREGLIDPEGQ